MSLHWRWRSFDHGPTARATIWETEEQGSSYIDMCAQPSAILADETAV
jgi:hypothetical protein